MLLLRRTIHRIYIVDVKVKILSMFVDDLSRRRRTGRVLGRVALLFVRVGGFTWRCRGIGWRVYVRLAGRLRRLIWRRDVRRRYARLGLIGGRV